MIVIGVDPGGRDTGLVVIDDAPPVTRDRPAGAIDLLESLTIRRADSAAGTPIEAVPRTYLLDVMSAVRDLLQIHVGDARRGTSHALIAVEGVVKPTGHAGGRRGHLIDPAGLLATAQVLGAILARAWSVPVVRVPPGGNGSALPWTAYPEQIRAKSPLGKDNRRHMRSAYDVALLARQTLTLERRTAR